MNPVGAKTLFDSQGYIVHPHFFTEAEMATLLETLQSLEPSGKDRLSKTHMTFYSNTFRRSRTIQAFISQARIVDFLRDIVGPDIWVRWDQAVEKRPGGEEFPWHQDSKYSKIKSTYFQFWVALTDMTVENGGLWVQPGSHKHGFLPHRRLQNHIACDENIAEPVFIEAKRGDVILFSSFLLHRTTPNRSDGTRWAYVVEYMPMKHSDPYIDKPYFVVARDGRPHPEFIDWHPEWFNREEQIKYWFPRLTRGARGTLKQLGSVVGRS